MEEHLTFKGIPITGASEDISMQLQSIGFIQEKVYPNRCISLTGTFAAIEDCIIFIIYSKLGETTWQVEVWFPELHNWFDLKAQYNRFKDAFIKKYGRPQKDFSFFMPPYEEGGGDELYALESENVTYMSFFYTDLGVITVELDKSCCLKITYEDKFNSGLISKLQESVVNDDI